MTSKESNRKIEIEKKEEDNKNDETTQKATKKSKKTKPKPPPPPTADELMGIKKPYYPKDLVAQGRTGAIIFKALINSQGVLENLNIIKSSGNDKMDKVAKLTIKNEWEFESYKKGYTVKVNVKYNMNQDGNPTVDINIKNLSFN